MWFHDFILDVSPLGQEMIFVDKVKMAKASYEKCKNQFDVVHVIEKYDDIVNELV